MRITAIKPVSLVDWENRQRICVYYTDNEYPVHAVLSVRETESGAEIAREKIAFDLGDDLEAVVMLPLQKKDTNVVWTITDNKGGEIYQEESVWHLPRTWRIHVMASSHTDIGLSDLPYLQRYNCSRFLDKVMNLCDETEDSPSETKYRYIIEGSWVFRNYVMDHPKKDTQRLIGRYIKTGKIGLCGGLAGNHTQVYGMEELCRAAYERKMLQDDFGIETHTMSMIDCNGMNWSIVQPYAEAGYRYIIFSPNHWNPLETTIWHMDANVSGGMAWNTENGGGGSRIDMRFSSRLPRIFFWESQYGTNRVLVFSGGMYNYSGWLFGLDYWGEPHEGTVYQMACAMEKLLPRMEHSMPYDEWFMPYYGDDQSPNLNMTNSMAAWNRQWQWPRFETCGDPDAFFDRFTERFGDVIPVMRGDITGGWYQHPLSTPDLLAQKFHADHDLATAEKLASVAGMVNSAYRYPREKFNRAWLALMMNDEHSYGVSSYEGRRVYETWMQHRDWINLAENTAKEEGKKALDAIAARVRSDRKKILLFNAAAQKRSEVVTLENGVSALVKDIPAFGYVSVAADAFTEEVTRSECTQTPPSVENEYYRVRFDRNGGMESIYDKQLKCELLGDTANRMLYTQDNHKTYHSPVCHEFMVEETVWGVRVTAYMDDEYSGARIVQTVSMPAHEKRIDLDNRLDHVRDMYNNCRYDRYLYYAFPFALENAKRICHLGSCTAEYAKDITGHCTDVYMAVNEWCCVKNDKMSIGFIQQDSELVEFDHIHEDKTDFGDAGDGSALYCYLANDWLQKHTAGGDDMNFRFRYTITSCEKDVEEVELRKLAERVTTPVKVCKIEARNAEEGAALADSQSFLSVPDGLRLLTLKRAEDGRGLIARLYGRGADESSLSGTLLGGYIRERETLIEDKGIVSSDEVCCSTWRIGADRIALPERKDAPDGYTGTMYRPSAARGEKPGMMYLLWHRPVGNVVAYLVYRGEKSGFEANDDSFVARTEQEEYVVGRYVDEGLKDSKRYYYRVRPVFADGLMGELSEEFSGKTMEIIK